MKGKVKPKSKVKPKRKTKRKPKRIEAYTMGEAAGGKGFPW